jgi:quercetin dioxygenase-like cupin family protein
MRLVVLKDKVMPAHSVAGSITVQCLEGAVAFTTMGQTQELRPGQILYLEGGQEHSLKGITDAALLLTILMT